MAPFFYLPHTIFVADNGLDHFDLSMEAQHALTRRFSAEGSIRAFIDRDPERAWYWFERWSSDPNAHVRRLVSEGTRLRLPWARRVTWLDENPVRVIDLLERLRNDPSAMVRRSVANNLNDIAKVHPDLAVATCAKWSKDASAETRELIEHALRMAVKRGHQGALKLLGYGSRPKVRISGVTFRPRTVSVGGSAVIEFNITNTSAAKSELLVDLVVHFVKANGKSSPKVFKLKRLQLGRRESARLIKSVSLARHTTRTPQAGRHVVEASINGQRFPLGNFMVRQARAR
jgi:3-methyladenine DNA glycosylase AlkC